MKLQETRTNSCYIPYKPKGKISGILRNRATLPASFILFEYDHKGGCEASMCSYENKF